MLLLLLLSRFSHVWPCNPIEGSPPGSTIPGNSPGKNTGVSDRRCPSTKHLSVCFNCLAFHLLMNYRKYALTYWWLAPASYISSIHYCVNLGEEKNSTCHHGTTKMPDNLLTWTPTAGDGYMLIQSEHLPDLPIGNMIQRSDCWELAPGPMQKHPQARRSSTCAGHSSVP